MKTIKVPICCIPPSGSVDAEVGSQASAPGVYILAVRPHHPKDGASGFYLQATVSRKLGFLSGEGLRGRGKGYGKLKHSRWKHRSGAESQSATMTQRYRATVVGAHGFHLLALIKVMNSWKDNEVVALTTAVPPSRLRPAPKGHTFVCNAAVKGSKRS